MKLPPDIAAEVAATPQPEQQSMLDAALDWARKGWPVFPLRPQGKEPLFPSAHKEDKKKCQGECGLVGHGVHDATLDPDVIRQWWADNPHAGIGGATTGRVVIDIDYQHGGTRAESLPATRDHLSGRQNGNTHVVYQAGGEVALALSQGKLAQGVDLKAGPAAYVVLPPSLHPDTRKPYTVANPEQPEHYITDSEVDEVWAEYGAKTPASARGAAPQSVGKPSSVALRDASEPVAYRGESRVLDALRHPSGEGGRNQNLTILAGHYARQYRDSYELYSYHVNLLAGQQQPPLDPAEVEKVKKSIWETEHSKQSEHDRRIEEQVEYLRIRGAADRIYREERRRDSEEAGHLSPGGEFVLDIPETSAVWGAGSQIGWANGEALMLVGPPGVGKSTLAAQLVGARLTGGRVLGLPVQQTGSKVLYLAMDRPQQIRRLLHGYLAPAGREVLNERLVVWTGPPPADLAAQPEVLLELAQQAGADTVVIDSLKDAAVGLSADETGAAYNRARQIALNAGVEVLELHHMVKKGKDGSRPDQLEDVYGSIWLTSGAGSVVLLWGAAGDTLVELAHLKQPLQPLGPWQVLHDRENSVSRVYRKRDALAILAGQSVTGLTTVPSIAAELFDAEKPDESEKQKTRRRLEAFEAQGLAKRHPGAVKISGQRPSDGWEATDAGRRKAAEDAFDASTGGDAGALFDLS